MKSEEGDEGFDEDEEDEVGEEDDLNLKSNDLVNISDELAQDIFSKLNKLQGKKTYYAKKNWTDDEAKLLQWAIKKYCDGKCISP